MGRSDELFREAVFLENRHRFAEAGRYYEQLAMEPDINLEMLYALMQYFRRVGHFSRVLQLSKNALESGGELERVVPLFLEAWEQTRGEVQELWDLYQKVGADKRPEIGWLILRRLQDEGENIYLEAIRINEKVERLFSESVRYRELYMDLVLCLLHLEVKAENFPQARFHLRKLLFLELDVSSKVDELFVYSVRLDLVEEWWENDRLRWLSQYLCNENWFFFMTVQKMHRRMCNYEEFQQFCQRTFHNPFLIEKQLLYIIYGKYILGKEISRAEVEKLKQYTGHWLAVKLLVMINGLGSYDLVRCSFHQHADLEEAVRIFHQLERARKQKRRALSELVAVTVLGGGERIGGSSILVSVGDHHLLLDAGLHVDQENPIPDYTPFERLDVRWEDLDGLIITHAHMDHSGAAPYVHRHCPQLPIYATEETKRLMEIILADLLRQRSQGDIGFSEVDLHKTLDHIECIEHKLIIPSKGDHWEITFYRSGHILGAVAVHLKIKGISIFYTGDFSLVDQKTVKGMVLPPDLHVDVLIIENTYGSLPVNTCIRRSEQEKMLVEQMVNVTKRGGNILIPAFALGRAQEIMMILHEHFADHRFFPFFVYVDGLVEQVSRVYDYYLHKSGCSFSLFSKGIWDAKSFYRDGRFDGFVQRLMNQGKSCIIASSGMLADGSASSRYAEMLIMDEKNAIAFSGYVDEESPGHAFFQDQADFVKLNGCFYPVKADIFSIRLSAHASREEIVKTAILLNPRVIFLVHGEHKAQYEAVRTKGIVYPTVLSLLQNNLTIPVVATKNGMTYVLSEGGVTEWK